MSVGACTLANSSTGMGQTMIERRIQGKSWAEIADEFQLKGPSAARTMYTKLTGITDYKIKGPALKSLVDNDMLDTIKGAIVKKTKKMVDDIPQTNMPGTNYTKVDVDQTPAQAFKAAEAATDVDPANKLTKYTNLEMQEHAAKAQSATLDVLESMQNSQYFEALQMHKSGQGYVAITKKTGLNFEQVDKIVWNNELSLANGNVFKALAKKPNSELGWSAANDLLSTFKQMGYTDDQIKKAFGVNKIDYPKPVKPPPTYTPTPSTPSYTSPTPAPQSQTYVIEGGYEGGFDYPSMQAMDDWHVQLGNDMGSTTFEQMKAYTGSYYSTINGTLRGKPGYTYPQAMVQSIDAGMRPTPFDFRVKRGVGKDTFNGYDMEDLVGKVWSDPAYMSTSISPNAGFGGDVVLLIDLPAGTEGRWVMPFSNHKGEQEFLLARGTKFLVTKVEKKVTSNSWGSHTTYNVHMKAIGRST